MMNVSITHGQVPNKLSHFVPNAFCVVLNKNSSGFLAEVPLFLNSYANTYAHHMPLGSGAIPPQPKRGGSASPKLAVHEMPTKPRDTVLLVRCQALSLRFWSE